MAPRYANATEKLPEELLAAVREEVGPGECFLWIPAERKISRERRNEFVVRLYTEGHSSEAIADRLFISQRTVFRILARARAKGAKPADATDNHGIPESSGSDD